MFPAAPEVGLWVPQIKTVINDSINLLKLATGSIRQVAPCTECQSVADIVPSIIRESNIFLNSEYPVTQLENISHIIFKDRQKKHKFLI